jgi:hypothetical protein
VEQIVTNSPSADSRAIAVTEARFRFVMILSTVMWTMQALTLLSFEYNLSVRVDRIEQKVRSAKALPVQPQR